ncbi:M9 family metallopeptidase [Tahibacter amnicola]|uniref:microbial collagenase n=1 Tax=Tahibacter amnicola TaxID=2976241 RepID=A0ABY6BIE4_9GAMM|nr:M9 family metallopeptidase [Tahibacter amnicola]UXI69534.1 M9 family metallopeptidase [Tahibacter amnicola]
MLSLISKPLRATGAAALLLAACAPAASAREQAWIRAAGVHQNIAHIAADANVDARPPLRDPSAVHVDYDMPDPAVSRAIARDQANTSSQVRGGTCDMAAFASASGTALVDLVKASDVVECLYDLFGVTGTQAGQIFGEAKMITIANALATNATTYPGDNSQQTLNLVMFLRAGYYVQDNNSADVGAYGTALRNAMRPAFDNFSANSHFLDATSAHGDVLSEVVTLIDSSTDGGHYLPTLKSLLNNYGNAHRSITSMQTSTNNVFNVLFRGHQFADFRAAVIADGSITVALADFIANNTADLGTGREYLLLNAGYELTRFLDTSLYAPNPQASARPRVKNILTTFPMVGVGGRLWASVADGAEYYDEGNCAYYGICDFRTALEAQVLSITHACSPTLTLRAQNLTTQQIADTCTTLGGEETYFHQKMATSNTPIAGDVNSSLQMLVFDSSADYKVYANIIFGIGVNNGGIYMEGDPTQVGNTPRFFAYETGTPGTASWQIWNLTHEYIHYLDGRFNTKGGFCDLPLGGLCDDEGFTGPRGSMVWYVEGIAEYLSYSYRNLVFTDAVAEAESRSFALSQLFQTVYSTDYGRTYEWGYLAARFVYEYRNAELNQMLQHFRAGNYDPVFYNQINTIGTSWDADFASWVDCYVEANGNPTDCVPDRIMKGNFEPPPALPECTDADERMLNNGCRRSNQSATTSSKDYFVWVPNGLTKLTLKIAGGTGNADMYVKAGGWASLTEYDYRPFLAGNDETVEVNNPAGGQWWYIMVHPRAPFTGMEISAKFN